MSLLRLLVPVFLIYLGYKYVKGIWERSEPKESVKGKPRNRPLNLDQEDVEDARYTEIQDKEEMKEP